MYKALKMKPHKTMRSLQLFSAVLLIGFSVATSNQVPAGQANQKAAEELGDRIVQRFHQTRDFGSIFKEFFVSNPALRQQEIYLVFGRRLNPEKRHKIDQAAVERAYIASMNFSYLLVSYVAMQEDKTADPPAEFEQAFPSLTIQFENISSSKELDAVFTDKCNHFFDVVRKHMPDGGFDSPAYKQFWLDFKEKKETANVSQMRQDFGIGKEMPVYVVKREFVNYFLIEEEGALKVFTISLRSNERW
jgi:hypothetical protein